MPRLARATGEVLIEADFGVPTTSRLVADVERMARRGDDRVAGRFQRALRAAVARRSGAGQSDPSLVFVAPQPRRSCS